jgi:hypothetical protein
MNQNNNNNNNNNIKYTQITEEKQFQLLVRDSFEYCFLLFFDTNMIEGVQLPKDHNTGTIIHTTDHSVVNKINSSIDTGEASVLVVCCAAPYYVLFDGGYVYQYSKNINPMAMTEQVLEWLGESSIMGMMVMVNNYTREKQNMIQALITYCSADTCDRIPCHVYCDSVEDLTDNWGMLLHAYEDKHRISSADQRLHHTIQETKQMVHMFKQSDMTLKQASQT